MKDREETSSRIYQSALRILEAEGPQAVSMRRVAKEVGITPMAIYHYFPSKEALLDAIVNSEFEHLVEFFDRAGRKRSFEAAMLHIMDGYIDYGLAHPRIFDYVFSAPRPGARRFPDDFRARRSPTLNVTADILCCWMEQKRIKRDDVWEIAMELWAHVHGYLALWHGGRFLMPEEEFRRLIRRSLRRLLYGLAQ